VRYIKGGKAMYRYPLAKDTWDNEEIEAINEVIRSKRYTMGPKVREFEQKFADYFGSKYAVMVNSGSSANLLAVASLVYSGRLNRGDEVIVPAVSWSTTYFPLYQLGLKLKFVDIDIETLNISLNKLQTAISEKTRAIFAVNLLGNPNDFEEIQSIISNRDIILLEDNCESMGAKFHDKYTGTFGLLGTYSTFYSHHICTMEGGMVVTNDEELYHYMLSIRAHGWTRDIPKDSKIYSKRDDEFYELFNFVMPGFNMRPLEMEAAIGIKQLEKLDGFISERIRNAAIFKEKFKSNENVLVQKEIGKSSWFGFSLVLRNDLEGKRDVVVKKFKELGIETRPIVAGDFTKNKAIEYMDYEIHEQLINADYIHKNGFFIGNNDYSDVDFEHLDF